MVFVDYFHCYFTIKQQVVSLEVVPICFFLFNLFREFCRDFTSGLCNREFTCRFPHKYIYCKDFQNTKTCRHLQCKFMHVSIKDQSEYEHTATPSPSVIQEAKRTNQMSGVCRAYLFKRSCPFGTACNFKRISSSKSVLGIGCPVCKDVIPRGSMLTFRDCSHVFCKNCATEIVKHRHCLSEVSDIDLYSLEVACPNCRNCDRFVVLF